jgi:NAD(P)-dependent dehydrogenase (short-subunit alcohol dehydrogenase family)
MSDSINSLFRLDGKIALVTGASSGLGWHFAKVLAKAGAHVVVAARRKQRLQALCDEIAADGGKASAVTLDVTDDQSVKACFDACEKAAGVPDVVLSNAGTTITKMAVDQTTQDFDDVINANLRGCWLVDTEAARRLIAAQKPGSIINTASILGERVAAAVAPYSISKAGVIQATKAMALEWARHDIRVNALLPGYVRTELNGEFLDSEVGEKLRKRIPSRRFNELTDLDGPVLLLASGAGRAMSGATVEVDSGHLVSGL